MNHQPSLHLSIHVDKKLRTLVSEYFDKAGNDIQANKDLYADLESTWKEYVHKVTRTQKRFKPGLDEFAIMHKRTRMVLQILERDDSVSARLLNALSTEELEKKYNETIEKK